MLAVAYAANVGGIGTKIGTIPSTQLSGFLAQRGVEVSFLEFAAIGVPFVLLFLPWWLALWRVGRVDAPDAEVGRRTLAGEGARLGAMRRGEKIVLAVFLATAAVWIMGKPLTDAVRASVFPDLATAHVEAGVAMLASFVLSPGAWIGGACLSPPRCASYSGRPWFSWAAAFRCGVHPGERALALARRAARNAARGAAVRTGGRREHRNRGASAFASNAATTAVMLPVLASSVAPEHAHGDPVRGDVRRFVRLRAAGRNAAQRDRVGSGYSRP